MYKKKHESELRKYLTRKDPDQVWTSSNAANDELHVSEEDEAEKRTSLTDEQQKLCLGETK